MAVAQVLARVTEESIGYLFTDDGGGGVVATMTNAQMIADMTAAGINRGGLWDLLHVDTNPNSQAAQRRLLLGDASAGPGPADRDMQDIDHATLNITSRSGLPGATGWETDAIVAGLRGTIQVTGPAAAGTALVTLQFKHTINR